MKIKTRLLAIFLVVVMLASASPIANAYRFNDVTRSIGDPFFDAINYMADNRFMSGSGGSFQPDVSVSRAMVATVLYYFSRETGTYSSSFTDVSSSAWYYNPVSWAAQKGIMYGTSNTVFNPNGLITREQLMATLYRYAGYCGKARDTTDRVSRCGDYSSISSYAIPAMNWAVNTGLLLLSSPTANIYPGAVQDRKWLALCMNRVSRKVLGIQREDRYAFNNSVAYMINEFTGNKYYMLSVDQHYILSVINSYYSATAASIYRADILERMKKPWVGSCRGFALTTILDKTGMIAFNENRTGYAGSTMNNFLIYNSSNELQVNKTVISAINYYQLLQYIPVFSFQRASGNEMPQKLREFVSALKQEGTALFSYSHVTDTGNSVGHAVIADNYSFSNGVHRIRIYDNRDTCLRNEESISWGTLTISSDYKTVRYTTSENVVEIPTSVTYLTDYSVYRLADLDGVYNDSDPSKPKNYALSEEVSKNRTSALVDPVSNGYTVVTLNADCAVRITNAEGEDLTFSNGTYSGSMPVAHMATYDSEPLQYTLYVPNSEKLSVEQVDGACDVRFLRAGAFTTVCGTGIEEISFYPDNRVNLNGVEMDCTVTGMAQNENYELIKLHGECANQAEFSFHTEGVRIGAECKEWELSLMDTESFNWATTALTDLPLNAEITVDQGELHVVPSEEVK